MDERYSRNRIYLTVDEQNLINDIPILLAGVGIGSVIAVCLLRFGFENITIVDGDVVETSNLNRQNYIETDVSKSKVLALKQQLLSINSNAKITTHNCFITHENVREFIVGKKIAINALDFSSDIPLVFDKICQEYNIPILHPYNLGWAGLVVIIDNIGLETLAKAGEKFNEVTVVQYLINHLENSKNTQIWIKEAMREYQNESTLLSPPQLSIASWLAAATCTQIAFDISTDKPVKYFPEFYFTTTKM